VDMGAYEDQSCPADVAPFGGNGIINIDDLVLVLNAFGGCGGCVGDATPSPGNGAVNIDDLFMILNAFGGVSVGGRGIIQNPCGPPRRIPSNMRGRD